MADLSIEASRDDKHVGVWVGNEKIASIGVRVKKWVTMHGLALNVSPNLEYFSFINPCGILDREVTSISKVLSSDVPMAIVVNELINHFSEVFDTDIEWGYAGSLRFV